MRLVAILTRSSRADMQAELRANELAVAAGTREAGRGLKVELKRQVPSARLGHPGCGRRAQQRAAREDPGRGADHPAGGDPGEPEQALGGFGSTYYQHAVEIEAYIEEGDAAARDATFDALLQEIGAALEADPTLGGFAFGLTYGRPAPAIEAIAGAPAIKSATLTVTVDYQTDAPLA
jgi:hypothetical protein